MNTIIFRRSLCLINHTKIYIQRFENCFDPIIIKADKGIFEEKVLNGELGEGGAPLLSEAHGAGVRPRGTPSPLTCAQSMLASLLGGGFWAGSQPIFPFTEDGKDYDLGLIILTWFV